MKATHQFAQSKSSKQVNNFIINKYLNQKQFIMRKSSTLNECCHPQLGWHKRLGRRLSPLGLILLLCVLLMPNAAKAQSVDGLSANQTFDFAALAQQTTTINWGDDYTGFTDNTPKYMGDSNGTSLEGRFATGTKSG
jgi:hypothetical protein